MNFSHNSTQPYQTGGSLPSDASTYVVRQADNDLYKALLDREYCYVLNARQMGKSSLRVQTMAKLQSQGILCTEIELSGIGSQDITDTKWYGGIIQELISSFDVNINRRQWMKERDDLSPVQQLNEFIETVLLQQIEQPLVIFIDEIDSVLSLKFSTDNFFALIRNCYNKRANNPNYKRLSFVLLGVATPSDLIKNPQATPFNIGKFIDLQGFKLEESQPLAAGLTNKTERPMAVLEEVLYWSGGQPFLTQKLCWLIVNSEGSKIPNGEEKEWVEKLVKEFIINHWESQDEPEHLRTIRDRLLHNSRSSIKLLELCQIILKLGRITARNTDRQMQLRLSGLVMRQKGYLVIKNPIYQLVFNENWIKDQLKILHISRQTIPLSWILSASFISALVILGIRSLGLLQGLELQILDHLMRRLPLEKPDERLLIIGADETDISSNYYGHPLPDKILAQLLDKIQQYQPRAIGLDIVRDQPVPPGHQDIVTQFQQNKNLVVGCAFNEENPKDSIKPPPSLPIEKTGFVNLYSDQDYIVRRYLLSRSPNPDSPISSCITPYSLGLQLTYHYFDAKKLPVKVEEGNWKFGDTLIKRLTSRSGGYQTLDARGNQLLLRYRHTADPQKIAHQVTVRDVLNGTNNFDPRWVKDRVVLIGVVATSIQDPHDLPYGRVRGLYLHAHLVSQLLSAIEDKAPVLISWLPWWGDGIVILFWSFMGGVWFLWCKNPVYQGLGVGSCAVILYGFCWFGLIQGVWLPLTPSIFALGITAISIKIYQVLLQRMLH